MGLSRTGEEICTCEREMNRQKCSRLVRGYQRSREARKTRGTTRDHAVGRALAKGGDRALVLGGLKIDEGS